MKFSFNFLCFVIAQCVVLSAALQCADIPYKPNCAPFNENNWLEGNCYCSKTKVNGNLNLCCNFQGKPAYLKKDAKEFPYNVISLTNSRHLDIYVTKRVTNLKIKNVAGGTISLVHNLGTPSSKLSIKKSNMSYVPLFDRTVLRECNIKFLYGASQYIEKLTLNNTEVEIFKDIRIKSDDKDGCFAMTNSVIASMENFHPICSSFLKSSKIGSIVNSGFVATTFESLTIDTIYSHGVGFAREVNEVRDTRVTHAHREAIIQRGWADVNIRSVAIENCEYPCFLIQDPSRVTLADVTADEIAENDPELLTANFKRKIEIPHPKICKRKETEIVCNLDYNEKLECIVLKTDFPSIVVKSRSPLIEVLEGCFKSLHLYQVLGLYHAFPPVSGGNNRRCLEKRSLKLTSSTMTTIYSKDLKEIQLIEHSHVLYLDLGGITMMLVQHSRLTVVENLEFFPRKTKNNSFVWFHVDTHIIRKMKLNAGARIDFLKVEKEITKLILNHHDERTVVKDSSIHSLPYRSIIIKKGELHLTNVKIDSTSAGAIFVKNGYLMIETTGDGRIDCSNGPAISTYYRSQVVHIGSITPDWLWECTEILEYVEEYGGHIILEHCHEVTQFELYCDLEHNPSKDEWGYLLGNTNALDAYKVVTVVNAPDLGVYRHCFNKISLINTTVSAMLITYPEQTCHYEMFLQNTTIPQILYNLMAINMLESNVTEEMSPSSHLATLNIDDSIITSLFVEVSDGTIINSLVKTVVKLNVTNEMIVQSCTVDAVKPLGIISYTHGSLKIIGTTFEELVFGSVIVHGILEMNNVSLPIAETGSISILSQGKIELTNVNFPHYTVISVQSEKSSIIHENVTVADKKVLWNGIQFVDEYC